MAETIAGAGDEIFKDIIRIQGDRLIGIIKDTTGGKIVAMKTDGNQPLGDGLRGVGEGLLTLALAEVELCDFLYCDLNHAVGELTRHHLGEPFAIQRGMVQSNVLENALPDRGIEGRIFRAAIRTALGISIRRTANNSIALCRQLGRCHSFYLLVFPECRTHGVRPNHQNGYQGGV